MSKTPLTDPGNRPLDDRAVSEVIGAILVFGLVVMLLSLVQLHGVPTANEKVEFEHSLNAQEDVAQLRDAITRAAAQGAGQSVSVELGTGYPARLMFYNPPAASGTLRTGDGGGVTIEHVSALDSETADYLSGTVGGAGNIDTRSIFYQADYNRYQSAPTSVFEYGTLVNQHPGGGHTVAARGSLVSGRSISLVTVAGGLSESQVGTASLNVKPVSAPAQTVAVSDDGNGPITITVPTHVSEEVWVQDLLAAELDEPSVTPVTCGDMSSNHVTTDDRYVVNCGYTENVNGPNELKLTFEQGVTYDLSMARVGVGDEFATPEAHYITTEPTSVANVQPGHKVTLVAQVRDRYNNPVSGTEVSISAASGTVTALNGGVTDSDGRVYFEYRAPTTKDTYDVTVQFDGGGQANKKANVAVTVGPPDVSTPNVDAATVTERGTYTCDRLANNKQSVPTGCIQSRPVHQVAVDYTVSDQTGKTESGLDYVRIEVYNGTTLMTKTTYEANSATSLSSRWVSPWFDFAPDEIRVTAVDRSGKETTTTLTRSGFNGWS